MLKLWILIGFLLTIILAQADETWCNNLPVSNNKEFINEINNLLLGYHYTKDYKLDNFDCSDHSLVCYNLLKERGYLAYCIVGLINRTTRHSHMWVAVPDEKGALVFIETVPKNQTVGLNENPSIGIGLIVNNTRYRSGYLIEDPISFLNQFGSHIPQIGTIKTN
jgi:hypothetical protein